MADVRLPVPTMDAVIVEFDEEGQVRYEDGEWSRPTVQETRAIIHAAREQIAALEELLASLDRGAA